jgi:2-polyprenyl-6-methoxyphenol hydroxylase-like FAD-dependent oxidoreductase
VTDEPDVVIVGGGIAGGALALGLARRGTPVLVLERQEYYRDLVRGEWLSPWGMADAERLGVADAIHAAGAWPLRRWVQWDEIYLHEEPPEVDLCEWSEHLVPGSEAPLAISHHDTCEALMSRATAAGADVRMGVKDVEVEAGGRPSVAYTWRGERKAARPRLVVGAGGRRAPVARQVGIRGYRNDHHWGGGLAIEGLESWPQHVQAVGTEGEAMFFVFPQGRGRIRLYLNYPTEHRQRYAGPDGARRFLDTFAGFSCLPMREDLSQAEIAGPCASFPSVNTWAERLTVDGVVVIGDEAGMNDAVLGTGLSNGLRDARMVTELLHEHDDWNTAIFDPYVEERTERLRRLHLCANLMARLFVEFGDEAKRRRRRALDMIRENPANGLFMLVSFAGPEALPDFHMAEFLAERLLAVPAKALSPVNANSRLYDRRPARTYVAH